MYLKRFKPIALFSGKKNKSKQDLYSTKLIAEEQFQKLSISFGLKTLKRKKGNIKNDISDR